VRTHY